MIQVGENSQANYLQRANSVWEFEQKFKCVNYMTSLCKK